MKKLSLFFRFNRLLYFILQGVGKIEKEHYLFTLPKLLTDFELYSKLADYYFQPNTFGFVYKGQIYQCRMLLEQGKYQYHLRFYDDGKTTGHREIAPEYSEKQHLKPEPGDLRTMNEVEALSVWRMLVK